MINTSLGDGGRPHAHPFGSFLGLADHRDGDCLLPRALDEHKVDCVLVALRRAQQLNVTHVKAPVSAPTALLPVVQIVVQVKERRATLDKKRLFQEQSALINKINRTLSNKVYKNFVPNYKTIASVYSIFQDALPVKDRVLLEENIVDQMSSSIDQQPQLQQPIDSLTYKTFVGKFNEEYSGSLNEEQKKLLGP